AFVASTFADLNDDFEKVGERLEAQKDDKTQAKISDSRVLRFWDHYLTSGTVPHVFAVDLESREVQDLMPGFDRLMSFGSLEWDLAPDGKEIAFGANHTDPPYQKLNFDLFLLALDTEGNGGEIRRITEANPASDGDPVYSPDGRFLLYGRTNRPEIAPDFTRLVRYDRKTGEHVELTTRWDHQPAGWVVSEDGETLFFHAQSKGRRNLYRMPVAGGTPQLVVEGGATDGVQVAAAGHVVYLEESFHRPDDLYRIGVDGGEPQRLTRFNDERLASIEFGEVEDVTFEGADGDAQMQVLLPPGFDPAKKWPLLVLVHGGPHGAWLDSFHYRWNAALFAAPGYVVAAVNFHGSTGFGQAFAESILGNHANKPYFDVMKATDVMLERDYIDPERLSAAGGSYGGYMVSWILGHTDRFACLINHAGVYDLMGQFASDYTWGRSNNYGASPWQDPERIDRYSPSRYAKNFNTPTLILHGELDYRVPVTQGINLHGVLTGKGVESRIVIFPKENHWILKPQAAELWWQEVHGWLEQHIGAGAD
ncbi:MAG: prolyl oligopeptidase family serine peptidase, partial [Acidobacteriota bacterium]